MYFIHKFFLKDNDPKRPCFDIIARFLLYFIGLTCGQEKRNNYNLFHRAWVGQSNIQSFSTVLN